MHYQRGQIHHCQGSHLNVHKIAVLHTLWITMVSGFPQRSPTPYARDSPEPKRRRLLPIKFFSRYNKRDISEHYAIVKKEGVLNETDDGKKWRKTILCDKSKYSVPIVLYGKYAEITFEEGTVVCIRNATICVINDEYELVAAPSFRIERAASRTVGARILSSWWEYKGKKIDFEPLVQKTPVGEILRNTISHAVYVYYRRTYYDR